MKERLFFISLLLLSLLLAPTAMAANTWYVDGVHGSDNNDCKSPQTACKTIGHAISLAASGDLISVAAATYSENLKIAISLKISGAGAESTIIDGGLNGTVVKISAASARVKISKVTIQNGSAGAGGGIANKGTLTVNDSTIYGNSAILDGFGGGIANKGTLTINNSAIIGNSSAGQGELSASSGGGIYNQGRLSINNSTLSGNYSTGTARSSGGGIANKGTLIINNCTLSGNFLIGGGFLHYGGAIANNGTLTISNSTFSENRAGVGGGISNPSGGPTVTLQNSIVANNSGGNCGGGGNITSNGYNLSSDNTCNFNNTGDLNNTDPVLGTLGNYGGPTQTIPLLHGSPAIDAGNPTGCTDGKGHLLKTDQRGKPRPDKEDSGGCDIGAFERQQD